MTATAEVLARVDDGDRSVRVERAPFVGRDGRPRQLLSIGVYERLFTGKSWVCRRRVVLRVSEVRAIADALASVAGA